MALAHVGIAARSAAVSASAVLIAVAVTGVSLVLLLHRSLIASIDDAAEGRVRDIVAALDFDDPAELDAGMLAGDERVTAVQVVDGNGHVLRRSTAAPNVPLLQPDSFGPDIRSGISVALAGREDLRVSGTTVRTAAGTYTVIVGVDGEPAERAVVTVALLLAVAAPLITAVSAYVNYRLVKRSLGSVEAIRARVSSISAHDLAERIPVPPQHDEISALAVTMNEMLARVEAGHTAQRRFVGDASHELRSPLASIISALEVAQDYPETVDRELTSGTLLPEAHRMQELIDDLLLLARADERKLSARRELVALDALAEEEAHRLRRETDLHVHLHADPASARGDPVGLSRMVRNLVDNAAHHARHVVEITVVPTEGGALIRIADDGPGIPECDRRRVFDRFERLDADRSRDAGGTGLGLAIVAEIVAAHGGVVAIDERPGGGAAVTVTLPAAG